MLYKFILMVLLLSIGCSETKIKIPEDTVKKDSSKSNPIETDNSKPYKYAIAVYDCPVLNTHKFKEVYGGKSGSSLQKSNSGLVKPLEFVAYPGTVFEIIDFVKNEGTLIYKVKTDEYPIILEGDNLYIDSRFVKLSNEKTEPPKKECPSKDHIYSFFDKAENAFYVWGGNNIKGIDKMLEFYPPTGKLNSEDKLTWEMKGLDCSGLIYEATNAYSPRNTHQLVNFGEPVEIKGLTASKIKSILKPLDIIVWKGHVVVVFDENTTIESSHSANGVTKKDLLSSLSKLMQKRSPENKWNDNNKNSFVIRRWFIE
jgi:hypothetical protein